VATADTASTNRANEINAKAALDISNTAYNNLWQEHRDEMDWGYKLADNEAERFTAIVRSTLAADAEIAKGNSSSSGSFWDSIGELLGTIYMKNLPKSD
jgi:hypothetical protein